jgi:transposase
MNMHQQGGVANRDYRPNVGVDVCKQHLDVCLDATDQRVLNDANGWSGLVASFKASNVDLVVLEATGGYEHKRWGHTSVGVRSFFTSVGVRSFFMAFVL